LLAIFIHEKGNLFVSCFVHEKVTWVVS